VFDILFGTFYNPRDFARENSFYDGAWYRIADLLRFRDVSTPATSANDMDDDSRVVTLRR
jgi:hypothetical protein